MFFSKAHGLCVSPSTNHIFLASQPLCIRPLTFFVCCLCSPFSFQTSYPLDVFGCQKMVVPLLPTM